MRETRLDKESAALDHSPTVPAQGIWSQMCSSVSSEADEEVGVVGAVDVREHESDCVGPAAECHVLAAARGR